MNWPNFKMEETKKAESSNDEKVSTEKNNNPVQ